MGGGGSARQRPHRRDGVRRPVRPVRAQRLHGVVGNARRSGPGAARRDRIRRRTGTSGRGAGGARRRRRPHRRAPADGVRRAVLAGVPAARRPHGRDRGRLADDSGARARPRRGRADRDAADSRRHRASPLVGVGTRAGAHRRAHRGHRVRGIRRAHDTAARWCRDTPARAARADARRGGAHRRGAAARALGGAAAAVRRRRHRLRRLRGRRGRAGHRWFRGSRALGPENPWGSPAADRPLHIVPRRVVVGRRGRGVADRLP